jgi:hypothetical protein
VRVLASGKIASSGTRGRNLLMEGKSRCKLNPCPGVGTEILADGLG